MQKILFFDDEPVITGYLVSNLKENFGWKENREIVLVSQVNDVFDMINNSTEKFDLFVLDVMAPVPVEEGADRFDQDEINKMDEGRLSGCVLAEKIRKNKEYEKVPIIYLSARKIPPSHDSEKNFTCYIRKPVSPSEISKKMNDLLGF